MTFDRKKNLSLRRSSADNEHILTICHRFISDMLQLSPSETIIFQKNTNNELVGNVHILNVSKKVIFCILFIDTVLLMIFFLCFSGGYIQSESQQYLIIVFNYYLSFSGAITVAFTWICSRFNRVKIITLSRLVAKK